MRNSQLQGHAPAHGAARRDSKMIEILTIIFTAIITMHMPTLTSTDGGLVPMSWVDLANILGTKGQQHAGTALVDRHGRDRSKR